MGKPAGFGTNTNSFWWCSARIVKFFGVNHGVPPISIRPRRIATRKESETFKEGSQLLFSITIGPMDAAVAVNDVVRSTGQARFQLPHGSEIQVLDFRSGPSGLSEKFETGLNRRVVVEATNVNPDS